MQEKIKQRFRLYLDESGDHTNNKFESNDKRYLCLTGIIVRYDLDHLDLNNEMDLIKRDIFNPHPDDPVIFHREDIIAKRRAFVKLWNAEVCKEFDSRMLKLFANQHYTIIAAVINKQNHQGRYGENAYNPYNYCLSMILERYCGWLNYFGAIGDVLAESRGGKEDRLISEEYSNIYEHGSGWMKPELFQANFTSKEIKIKKKYMNIAGLQLADLLSYTTKQDILIEKGIIADDRTEFEKEVSRCISGKYNQRFDTGEVFGYGKILRN